MRVVLLSCAGAPLSAALLLSLREKRPDLLAHVKAVLLSLPRRGQHDGLPPVQRLRAIARDKGLRGLRRELAAVLAYRAAQAGQRLAPLLAPLRDTPAPLPRIEAACEQLGIPTASTRDVNSGETLQWLRGMAPDMVVVTTFHHILKRDAIGVAALATLNVHASYLPAFRGADPIGSALKARVDETGITVHWVDEGIDTGDIVAQARVPVGGARHESRLIPALAQAGARCLAIALDAARAGDPIPRQPQ